MNFTPHDYQDYAIRYIEKHPVAAVLLDTVNIFDIDLPMLVPFTTLFLAPTYGVRIEQLSNMAALSIIAIIAIVYIVYCAVEAKRVKRN